MGGLRQVASHPARLRLTRNQHDRVGPVLAHDKLLKSLLVQVDHPPRLALQLEQAGRLRMRSTQRWITSYARWASSCRHIPV